MSGKLNIFHITPELKLFEIIVVETKLGKGRDKFPVLYCFVLDLLDIWRVLNPATKRYTLRKKVQNTIQQSRLDYFIIAYHRIYNVQYCQIKHAMCSDHNPVKLSLRRKYDNIKGRDVWKLNDSLLKDQEYLNTINSSI